MKNLFRDTGLQLLSYLQFRKCGDRAQDISSFLLPVFFASMKKEDAECPHVFLCLIPVHPKNTQAVPLFPSYPEEIKGCWISSILLQLDDCVVDSAGRAEGEGAGPACCSMRREGYTGLLSCQRCGRETGNVHLGAWQCERFDIFFIEIFAASGSY